MSTLHIQPYVYNGKKLKELAERIVMVFHPILDDYLVKEEVYDGDVDALLSRSLSPRAPPYVGHWQFLRYLASFGTPILGVTILHSDYLGAFGEGSSLTQSAYVSCARPEFDKVDSKIHMERLLIEGLHELGHVFDLDHHDDLTRTLNGKLCPMDTSLSREAHLRKITWGEYISSRDTDAFCKGCHEKLELLKK